MDKAALITKVKEGMEKSIKSLQDDLTKIRTGRASTNLLDDVRVESYGSRVPLNQVATLATPEPRLVTVNPFDKSQLTAIEKAILTSGLGYTPNNDGKIIRVPIPALSEERRKDIAKQVKKLVKSRRLLCGITVKMAIQRPKALKKNSAGRKTK